MSSCSLDLSSLLYHSPLSSSVTSTLDANATMTIDCDKTLGSKLQYSSRELDEDGLFASSKVILTAQFSEIRTDSGSFIHTVQLVLTTDCEIVVLKLLPSDKSNRRSSLRKHNIGGTEFTMHTFLPTSLTAIVPGTILRYSYQLNDNQKSTIGEWLHKIVECKFGKTKKSKVPRAESPNRESTTTAGQSTSYAHTYSSPSHPVQRTLPVSSPSQPVQRPLPVSSHSHPVQRTLPVSSPSHPVQRPLPVSFHRPTVVETMAHLSTNEHSRIMQMMPSGLIKARSFQERGSVKEHFIRRNSSSLDLNNKRVNTTVTDEGSSTPRTPSPPTDDNPFESRLRHTQVRNKKRIFSPRGVSRNAVNPLLEEVKERSYCSRSANSTPLPGLGSSLVIASPSAEASEMAGSFFTRGWSGTLPRAKKGKKERLVSESGGHGSPSRLPIKSPKLLRMFHRRWQSSSAIKVSLPLDGEERPSSSGEPRKLHQFPPKEVAEELSCIDAQLLRKIGPEELENGAWMKKDSKDKVAPNIMAMVRSFNQLALLIPSEILEEKTSQGRAKIISTYIQIASKLYSSHNYNSLKAVLAGLQSTPIYRLNKTWKEVASKKRKRFQQLSALMSELDNWELYRRELEEQLSSQTPVIPFLGQFLTQVVQVDTYHQARKEREVTPPSQHRERVRSSSLHDNTDVASDTLPIPSGSATRDSELNAATLSVSAPTSPAHNNYEPSLSKKHSLDSEEHSKSLSSDSSCLSPPPSVGLSDEEEEVDGQDDAGSHTTDSGHHSAVEFRPSPSLRESSSTHATLSVPKISEMRRSQIELSHIYVSLQRQSQSYETLLNTYTQENEQLKGFVDSTLNELTKLSKTSSLQSLDSVFSDDDEEDEENDSFTCSLNVPLSESFDSDHTSDYGSDPVHVEFPGDKTKEKRKAQRILFRAKFEAADNCLLSPDLEEGSVDQQEGDSPLPHGDKWQLRRRLQRSKSCYASGSKGKRRRSKKKAHDVTKDEDYQEPKTPLEILNSFQVASLGYSLGTKENIVLRSAICDTEPNSESISYKLSVEREAHELTNSTH